METHPPKLIEAVVERLIPPACREHVLGDLYERYESPAQYLRDILTTVPFVIASQVRRSFNIGLFVAQASALYISFAGPAFLAGAAYLYDHSALLPLAIVIGVVLLVLVLCEAYMDPNNPSPRKERPESIAILSMWLLQGVVSVLHSEWTLPIWITMLGSAVSIPVLWIVRRLFGTTRQGPAAFAGGVPSLAELRRRSESEHAKAWALNWVWLTAALIVFYSAANLTPPRFPSLVLVILIIIVFFQAYRLKEGRF